MKSLPSKRLLAVATAALLLVGAGGAYAYWSVGGIGTATEGTGTVDAIIATQTSTIAGLDPGAPAQTISGNFSNDNTGPVYVSSVVGSISRVVKATDAPSGTCDATDYVLSNATMLVGAEVEPGSAVGSWSGATIRFHDNPAINQDACKGATVTLSYAVN